jgi:hypothetical protein
MRLFAIKRAALAGACVAALLAAAPGAASAATKLKGVTYGGFTPQGLPVVIEIAKNGRTIARTTIAIQLKCTSGATVTLPDTYGMPVKKRKFHGSFNEPLTNADGTITTFHGEVAGRFNKARTKVSGKWLVNSTTRDGAGAVVDTCTSGTVRWTAKQ